jgi:ATP-dependent exoDNAse (exonuclease V) alpha subunit
MNQKTAFEILRRRHNVFLTGPPGSGKTYLLNKFIGYLKSKKVGVAVTASTGIAATHMDGITIHSWSGMGVKEEIGERDLLKISRNGKMRRRFRTTKVLIIDEISMLHSHQMENVDKICRKMKDPFLPFGGLQIVLSGDFFQLPPVEKDKTRERKFAFSSRAWREANVKVCYLDEQHRQEDVRMIDILNGIRAGKMTKAAVENLLSRKNKILSAKMTRLFSHNIDADAVNENELSKIKGKSVVYKMHAKGNKVLVGILKQGCLAPEKLVLKKGARVMFVKNNFEAGYVNGTLGEVIGFDEDKMPIVKTSRGRRIIVSPEKWVFEENDIIGAQIRQLPLRLAWAITIHKSQGMTLDMAEIDLGKSFECGMGYVALSRVRSLEGINLLGINKKALEVNAEMRALDAELMALSKVLDEKMAKKRRR